MGLDAAVFTKAGGQPVLEVRLGNIAQIAYLREHLLAAGVEPAGALFFCVAGGSHSGDEISFERIAALRAEIEAMFKVQDPEVRTFLDQLRALTEAAEANESPICFV